VIRTDGANDALLIATPINASGANVLTKSGNGLLTLPAANAYTGATNVNAGILQLRNLTGAGTSAGGVAVRSGAALRLSLTGTYATETLSLNGAGAAGAGSLLVDVTSIWSGAITVATASVINVAQGASFTASAAPVLTGDLTKAGLGTLLISAGPTGSGALHITAGTVNITSSRLPGAINVNNAGTLLLTGNGTNSVADTTVNTVGVGGAIDWQQTNTETLGTLLLNGAGINNAGAITTSAATSGGVMTVTNGIILQSNASIGAASGGELGQSGSAGVAQT
jgi:autotransporter-associated beta strand protein